MSSDLSTVIARHRTLLNSLGVSSKNRESSVSQSDSISIELGGEVEVDCMSILITYPCCWGALRMDDANSILQCGTKIMWLTHFSSMTGLKESPTLNTWICWWQKTLVSAWGTSCMALFLRRSSTAALVSTIQLWIQMKWLYLEWRGYTLRGEEGVPKVSGLRPVLEEGFLLKAIADGKLVQMLLHVSLSRLQAFSQNFPMVMKAPRWILWLMSSMIRSSLQAYQHGTFLKSAWD